MKVIKTTIKTSKDLYCEYVRTYVRQFLIVFKKERKELYGKKIGVRFEEEMSTVLRSSKSVIDDYVSHTIQYTWIFYRYGNNL